MKSHVRSITSDVVTRHPNIGYFVRLARRVSFGEARRIYHHGELGELIAGAVFRRECGLPDPPSPVLRRELRKRDLGLATFNALVDDFGAYLREDLSAVDFSQAEVCGFSLCIHQTMSSLAWAQAIKRQHPHIRIVFGGSHCEDPMGLALMKAYSFIDYVARGECDGALVPLFRHLLGERDSSGKVPDLHSLPNIAFREDGNIVATAKQIVVMAATREPDYSDFRDEYSAIEKQFGIPANYYIEGSRGCWWGQRNHCVFCGINTSAMQFREKSPEDLLSSIQTVSSANRTSRFVLSDTILSMNHLHAVIPALERLNSAYDFQFMTEVKSNLRKEDIFTLARAGCIAFQPGIESFSTRLLRRMKKGSTALRQIQFLEWAQEAGIYSAYSILTHFVDEQPEDYDEILGHLQRMTHLVPPGAVVPIEINRYSPYFSMWQELGFDRPAPSPVYHAMFGPDGPDLEAFAYCFEGLHPSTRSRRLELRRRAVSDFVSDEWKPRFGRDHIQLRVLPDFVEIVRSGAEPLRQIMEPPWSEVYLACDQVSGFANLAARFGERVKDTELRAFLEGLCEAGLMTRERSDDVYLALALRSPRQYPTLPDHPATAGKAADRGVNHPAGA